MLIDYIDKLHIIECTEIIVSDNNSQDDTEDRIHEIIKNTKVEVLFFKQLDNIGLENNALSVLSRSHAKYVMYIGDDDYININYLEDVITEIKSNNPATVIVSSILGVTSDNKIVGFRGIGERRERFKMGYDTASLKMYLGNQLSGMTFLRESTLKSYEDKDVSNIYLFVYFIGFNMLRGSFLYIKEYPVKVTEGAKKDWGYNYDGLLNDFFRNYKVLFKNKPIRRVVAEISTLNNQPFRFGQYLKKGPKVILLHLKSIFSSTNISTVTKILYVPIIIIKICPIILRKIILRKIILRKKIK
jgi:hypothetical protein